MEPVPSEGRRRSELIVLIRNGNSLDGWWLCSHHDDGQINEKGFVFNYIDEQNSDDFEDGWKWSCEMVRMRVVHSPYLYRGCVHESRPYYCMKS